jgi:CTP:molybdopterin cytidylyltransferase MocA
MTYEAKAAMDAIVTAGGRLKGKFATLAGQEIKALLEINGRTLLERTIRALEQSQSVGRIVVVGPPEVQKPAEAAGAALYAPEEATGIDNLLAGVRSLEAEGQVLLSTSDLPTVQPEDVDDLVGRVPETADVSYAIFSRPEYEATFPTHTKRYVALGDGKFTGGCVFVAHAATLRRLEPTLQALFRARKNPLALGRIVGGGLFVRFVLSCFLGRWLAPTTEQIRQRVEEILNVKATLVRGASPRLALDVDSRRDWEFVKAYCEEQERPRQSLPGARGGDDPRASPLSSKW